MCLVKIVFAVFVCTSVINNVFVSSQDDDEKETREEKEDKAPPPLENHSFVALIDILFTDGSKRTCTGTIIHNHAVITAAHCFLTHGPGYADVEMSGSFIVLGTKKMFDTGYENYLPIERIITHPRYRGWTANLALVFTFAGMTTDKPGNSIPLIGEGSSTPVDSNVTILSWGRCLNDDESVTKWPSEKKKRKCSSSEENNESCEPTYKQRKASRTGSEEPNRSNSEANQRHHTFRGEKGGAKAVEKEVLEVSASRVNSVNATSHHSREAVPPLEVQKQAQSAAPETFNDSKEYKPRRDLDKPFGPYNQEILREDSSQLLRSAEEKKKENLTKTLRRHRKHRRRPKVKRKLLSFKVKKRNSTKNQDPELRRSGSNVSLDGDDALKLHYKDFRRKSKSQDPKENKLTVESFGFVNVQTCKKIVDKSMPREFAINTNEVVCYAAEEHYISDDDSGAPAVRQGQLVAVTVGGAQCDGDHVAVGMRMNCFCSWIVDNLPAGDHKMNCCTDCCREKRKATTHNNEDSYYKHRNRKDAKSEELD
ncbi:hypothetical protein PYW07_016491 [Mythimna separata]|uniref:Peptidase S1 domain-containing protein n=1 Tax=Mythimna separata TaxID=271217 RepID=A0AAD7YK38_MYTSE|nr:hypothetical protein PYW07_016491 [Mythimna separata]